MVLLVMHPSMSTYFAVMTCTRSWARVYWLKHFRTKIITLKLQIFGTHNIDAWQAQFDALPEEQKDIYAEPKYVICVAEYYGYIPEAVCYGDDDAFVLYPYFKRSLENLNFFRESSYEEKLYDIVASWYFGGPYIKAGNQQVDQLVKKYLSTFNDYCVQNGIIAEFVRYDPNLFNHEPFEDFLSVEENRQTVYVDLTQSDDEIWKDFRSSCQRSIKKARKNLTMGEDNSIEAIRQFYAIYDSEMRRKDAPPHSYFTFDFLKDIMAVNDEMRLLLAYDNEKIIGGFMVAGGYGIAHHYLSASDPEYWSLRVNNLMFYSAIMDSKEAGYHTFDFQGGPDGVYRFKENYSSTRRTFYIAKVVHDQKQYDELTAMARDYYDQDADTIDSGFFPAYRQYEGL